MSRTAASSSSSPKLHLQERTITPRERWILVFVSGMILGVVNMDTNGISTILPTIGHDLGAGNNISWAGTSSLVATAVFSMLYGRLSDIFGRKVLFVGSLGLFSAGELACSFARDGPMLYFFRAVTGLSGGGVGNLAMIITSDVISLADRGKYMGIAGSFMALGNIIGPFIAAGFANSSTWRAFFWLMTPLGALTAIAAVLTYPSTTPTDGFWLNVKKIDYLGSFTSTITTVFFLIPLSGGGLYFAWASPLAITMLTLSGVFFILFVLVEMKWASLPIFPISMFDTRDVCALFAQAFLIGWAYQASTYLLPVYFQNLRGWSPLASAGLLTAITGVQVIASAISGRRISQKHRYGGVLRSGILFSLLGSGLMIALDGRTNPGVIVLILAVFGVGVGNSNQPIVVALQAHTAKDKSAVVISARTFFRFIGGACGVAVSVSVLQSALKSTLPSGQKHIAGQVYSLPVLNGTTMAELEPAYVSSFRKVFIVNTAVSAAAMLFCLLWHDKGLDSRPESGGSDSQEETTDADEGVRSGANDIELQEGQSGSGVVNKKG